MNIETVVKETIRELDNIRNKKRLHFIMTPELKLFYREQCLNYLLKCQQSILDYINSEHNKESIEQVIGEFDYISDLIRIRQRIDCVKVNIYNAQREHVSKFLKENGEEYKTGYVATAPTTIDANLKVTGKKAIFRKTKGEAILSLKELMYKNSEYYGV